ADPRQVPLIMLQGGIHPGESDGKDAGFIALRELLGETASPGVLERIAILFVPAFNVDGHERFGRWNRPNQNGPEEMGWRTTAQNLNLNRDYTKADAPEMRSLLGLLRTWDPLVCADLHVTDGADFQPDISLQVEPVNQGDAQLCAAGRELRDALIAKVARSGSMPLPFYPDLATPDDPSSGFQLTVYSPRFSTGYFPQRHLGNLRRPGDGLRPEDPAGVARAAARPRDAVPQRSGAARRLCRALRVGAGHRDAAGAAWDRLRAGARAERGRARRGLPRE